MSLLLESAIKGSAVAALALGLMPVLRGAPAAFRHWVLSAALVCAAITPAFVLFAPSWRLPAGPTSPSPVVVPSAPVAGTQISVATALDAGGPQLPAPAPSGRRVPVSRLLQWAWIAGAGFGLFALLTGYTRLTWLASRARRITGGPWADHAERVCREYAIARPVAILQGPHPALLVTWGIRRPKILLPPAALGWTGDRIRHVLYHELAHVRRNDWFVQLGAELLRAVYWFNPILWIACSRLRQESEQACDDAVLDRGVDGQEYALELVNIARDLMRSRFWMAGLAIAHTSNLERRVKAMLNMQLNRRPVSSAVRVAAVAGLLALTFAVGSFAASQTATISGSIVDPMNAALPDVTVVLTNLQTQARSEMRSDRSGHYGFEGVAPGDYLLEARLPGFATSKIHETISGGNIKHDLMLQLGSIQETVHVAGNDRPMNSGTTQASPRKARACGDTPPSGGVAVGGNVRAPLKTKDVRPYYPDALLASGVEGTVLLEGRLGADGLLHGLKAVSDAHADLVKAAIDAAAQWEFEPVLLNCVPFEIPIKITVRFQR